jgi:phosphate/sulfate permease
MTLLIVIIILALIFDYINGFHDAANSIATIVATKVLTPFQAVFWAAFFNFLAYWVFGFGVADTVAKTAKTDSINLTVILAGVIAAIVWNLITWWYGIASCSSHTLIGGFAGAFLAAFGWDAVRGGVVGATAIFIVVAPVAGMIMAYLISIWFLNSFRKGPWMKMVSLAIIAGTCYLVWGALEFKKDFNGAHSYTLTFADKVDKENLKTALKFKDENLKEYSPVVKAGKDSTGAEDKSGRIYVVRTDFMKMFNDYQDMIKRHATTDLSDSQPTKGNIAGGLTTKRL